MSIMFVKYGATLENTEFYCIFHSRLMSDLRIRSHARDPESLSVHTGFGTVPKGIELNTVETSWSPWRI